MAEDSIATRAENAMKIIMKVDSPNKDNLLTTSQIRKFLTAVTGIQNKVNKYVMRSKRQAKSTDGKRVAFVITDEDIVAEIQYLKVILAYQEGKETEKKGKPEEKTITVFRTKAKIDDEFKKMEDAGYTVQSFHNFAKYIEALVAYHKFYGGRDN